MTSTAPHESVTFRDALWSEWTKVRTLRSAGYVASAAAVLMIGVGVLGGHLTGLPCRPLIAEECAAYDATRASLRGYVLAEIGLGLLGSLAVTSEYATGMIRTSLTTAPCRGRLLAAKAVVCSAVAIAVGGAASLATVLMTGTVTQPGMLRAVAGATLFMGLIGPAGVAVGFLVRSTMGAVAVLLAATLAVPDAALSLPDPWYGVLLTYWPTSAGARFMSVRQHAPWTGLGVLAGAVIAILVLALLVLRRREC